MRGRGPRRARRRGGIVYRYAGTLEYAGRREGHLVSCDVCGRVIRRPEATTIYVGEAGQKVDYCPDCLKAGRGNVDGAA
jgi:hypothetical protein